MEIQSAYQIGKREWENIAVSLKLCGDIGDFEFAGYIESNPELVLNLEKMEDKIPVYDYLTKEAAYVFTEFSSEAALNLGLNHKTARAFGGGYSLVRTGWFDLLWLEYCHIDNLKENLTRQIFFYNLFFPTNEDYDWVFDGVDVGVRLKSIYEKFISWQDNPIEYDRVLSFHKNKIDPMWDYLTITLAAGSGRC